MKPKIRISEEGLNEIQIDLLHCQSLKFDILNKKFFSQDNPKVTAVAQGLISNEETWAIDILTGDQHAQGFFGSYLYESESEYQEDLETLGFFTRKYFLFGDNPTREYYERINVEDISVCPPDGTEEGQIYDGSLYVFDPVKDTLGDLLSEADGWGGHAELNLFEYRQLRDRMNSPKNQVPEIPDPPVIEGIFEVRGVYEGDGFTESAPLLYIDSLPELHTLGIYHRENPEALQYHVMDIDNEDFEALKAFILKEAHKKVNS